MTRTLSELGFASREALIVVPHRQATRPPKNQLSSYDGRNTQSGAGSGESAAGSGVVGGGYFEYVQRFMSYMNPFSYFGGGASSSSSEPSPSAGLWQYRKFWLLLSDHLKIIAVHELLGVLSLICWCCCILLFLLLCIFFFFSRFCRPKSCSPESFVRVRSIAPLKFP